MKTHSYLYFAKKDLQAAQTMLAHGMYDHCVRLCQQYIEKSFKEALDNNGEGEADQFLLHTHRVHRLATRCSEILKIKFTREEKLLFRQLTHYYFDTNYPNEDYTEVTIEEAQEIMTQTLQFQDKYEKILAGE